MHMKKAPRALVLMDLCAMGRCSLSVAVPVLSAMGVQACALPTMLLSAHTGFAAPEKLPVDGWFERALMALADEPFDAVYVGYLASDAQISGIERFWALRKDRPYLLVDPAMADHGRLYSGIGQSRPQALTPLLALADLATPNQTELIMLGGADALLALGCRAVLTTGGGRNTCLSRGAQPVGVPYEELPGEYPGTGDLFASALLGSLLNGQDMERAISRAAAFVQTAIERTNAAGADPRHGVAFEQVLRHI